MVLPTKMKTTVDLHVSTEVQRLVALNGAVEIAAASIEIGNEIDRVEVTSLADYFLSWLQQESTQNDEQGSDDH